MRPLRCITNTKKITEQINEDNDMLHEKLDADMEEVVKEELKELEPQKNRT